MRALLLALILVTCDKSPAGKTTGTTTAVGLVRLGHATDSSVEIVTPHGLSIRVRRGFDAEVLQQVLRVLAQG